MQAGYAVHLANLAAIVQYQGLKHSADEHDARWLARRELHGTTCRPD